MVKLTNVSDKMTAETVCAYLETNGIQAFVQAPDLGEMTHIVAGRSIYGYDIVVKEELRGQAEALLEQLQEQPEDSEWEQELQQMRAAKAHLRRRFGRICLAAIMILAVTVYAVNVCMK